MAATNSFVSMVGTKFDPDPENNVFNTMFREYERVIFQSIITSFALDGLIQDRRGGDVDTIFNVRGGVAYKNTANEEAYKNRGEYNSYEYHDGHAGYRQTKRDARVRAQGNSGVIKDDYTGGNIALTKSKSAPPKVIAELDHVIAAKKTHDDPGRVLAGTKGADLANSPDNLKFTNKSLNASMRDDSIPEYIEKHPELSEETKANLMKHYNNARKSYERKIAHDYYTSPGFWKDTSSAAAKVGAGMAVRQTIGFVMTEVWFTVKEKLANARDSAKDRLLAIAAGIKEGFANAKVKYKELLSKLGEGAVAGVLSSLTTTLCNIFFTTAKNVVRIVRQAYASVVETAKILLFNPNGLPFSERIRTALKILATGASIVLGTVVQEVVGKALLSNVGAIPLLGGTLVEIISVFCGSLCTGFLTVTLLYLIDNDPFHGFLTRAINQTVADYRKQAQLFEAYAVRFTELNIADFRAEVDMMHNVVLRLETAKDDREINMLLKQTVERLGISIPWGDRSLDEFMKDKSAQLYFST